MVFDRRRTFGKQTKQMLFMREHPEGIVFKVFVQPRSAKNKIVGAHGDALKIKITAPPVAGAANKMCLKFLAKSLAAPPLLLEIINGHNSRTKQLLLRSEQAPPSDKEKQRLKQRIEKLIHV
jgi:uncharacterized protein (TIGR00251 family)